MNVFSTQNPVNAPVFIWGLDMSHGETAESLFDEVKALTNNDFSLAVFDVTDWNAQFSPWTAPAVFGKDSFSGKGNDTLRFLEDEFLPEIKSKFPKSEVFLTGYSLAGLFSLWALYETDKFNGAVCCSSSLWFDKWDEYASLHRIKSPSTIYMSLGDREEKTKNKVMSKVGDRTRRQAEILKEDPNVEKLYFEWNEGGHFVEPLKRVAKGITRILG
ncbi:MAG: alpha/beta hydrolase-fold protein [Treponema berlinense]|uniref:alpha/beta hydrolase n=1 Tax=Treponema berlinense TaxID=225004 RepID=UPI002A8407EE|nr:alpha/beta hydrolase-fold protein [Treponema berlinense]MDY3707381.1 alpha/beta hydrolase-fold protein [Treponema berlinense]